jgi:transposase InsO family protein
MKVAAFARSFGISEMTLRKWLARYEEGGAGGLTRLRSGPRKPRGQPLLAAAVKAGIVETWRRFPAFGLKKIRDFLARFGGVRVSTGSVRKTLVQAGVRPAKVAPRKRRRRAPAPQRFERSRPGELWQTDITYLYVPWRRQPLYLVAYLDDFSRFVVSWGLHTTQRQEIVLEALEEAIQRWGPPAEVISDQGRQYHAWRGKTAFERLLKKKGIEHVLARAHRPETKGKIERLWETVKKELWELVEPKDLEEARERLRHWFLHYNHFRPSQALGGLVPADRFFGAEKAVREAIEKTLAENELRLAVGQEPRKPVFLVGQIGDQQVSLHGERGRIVVQTPDGRSQVIGEGELGMVPAPTPRKEETDERDEDERAGGGAGGHDGAASAAPGHEAHEVRDAAAGAAPGAGALAGGERGGADAGAPRGGDDAGVVAGEDHEGGGGGASGGPKAAVVADEPAGGGGPGGGAARAAQGEGAAGGGGDPAPRGGSAGAASAGVPAPEGTGGDAGADRAPEGDAGPPAGDGPGEGDRRWRGSESAQSGAPGRPTP